MSSRCVKEGAESARKVFLGRWDGDQQNPRTKGTRKEREILHLERDPRAGGVFLLWTNSYQADFQVPLH